MRWTRKQRRYGERYPLDEDFLAALAADAGGERRRARLRPAGDAGDRRARGSIRCCGRRRRTPHDDGRSDQIERRTLRSPAELVARGLAPADELTALDEVAARYAVAITPRDGRSDRPGRSARSDRAAIRPERRGARRSARPSAPIRSATPRIRRSTASCIAIPTACCSSSCMSARSIAASASAARWSAPARTARCRRDAYRAALAYIRAHAEIWEVILTGGDPLMLSPRRLAEVMADLAAIDARQDRALSHPRAGGRAGAHHAATGRGAEGRRRDDLGGAACQSSARTDGRRARGLRAASSMPALPMVSQSVLLRGRQRRCGRRWRR